MPKRNKKCEEKVESSTRPVLESLDICSHHQKIPSCSKADEHTPCLSSQCSRKTLESSLKAKFCTDQTCSSAGCGKPLLPCQSRSNQQLYDENIECPKPCNDLYTKTDEKAECYGCCPSGVQIRTIKEALDELKELRSQISASSQGRPNTKEQGTQNTSNINIPCFQDNTQSKATITKREVPQCCEVSDAQQSEGSRDTTKNELIRKQSETMYCPYKIPQCCHPELLNVTKHDSSKDAALSGQNHEANKPKNCYDDVIKVPPGEHKDSSTTDIRHNGLKLSNARISPTFDDQNSCPSPTSLGNQKETSAADSNHNGLKLSNVGNSTSAVEKCYPSPVCGLHINETKEPERTTSLKDKESKPQNNNMTSRNDDSENVKLIPCSGPCITTDKVISTPKKCECHFPPAYNQFGCTGNISGNCNCTNI